MRDKTIDISLGDSSLFKMAIGRRKTKKELQSLPSGDIPIISARLDRPFGYIETKSFVCNSGKTVLWNIDSSRWDTRVIEENFKFIPTDHCGYMIILNSDIVPEYIAYKLYEHGLHMGFKHEYRASLANIKEVSIPIPVDESGNFDINVQRELAQRYHQCTRARVELLRTIDDLCDKRINISSKSKFVRVAIGTFMTFKRGNEKYTEKYCKEHQGCYPVYSSGTKAKTTIGHIDTYDYEGECVKITTNGHYAGTVEFLAESKFSLNGDAGILYITNPSDANKIDYRYIEYALQNAREQYGFNWINKPYERDIMAIEIQIPIKRNKWDIVEQRRIAERFIKYKEYISKLQLCVDSLQKQFIKID